MASQRPTRVGEQIREDLTELLAREVHDPGVGFLTITRVQVTSDLQIARVFYTTLGDAPARKQTSRALERATPFLRRHVAGRLRLRRAPELEFRFDETIEHQDRLEQILRDLHQEEAQRAEAIAQRAAENAPADANPESLVPNPEPDDDPRDEK